MAVPPGNRQKHLIKQALPAAVWDGTMTVAETTDSDCDPGFGAGGASANWQAIRQQYGAQLLRGAAEKHAMLLMGKLDSFHEQLGPQNPSR